MNLRFSIIFLAFLLQPLVLRADTQAGLSGSAHSYNEALKEYKSERFGYAKAHAQKSLFINPWNSKAYRIKDAAQEKIFENQRPTRIETVSSLQIIFNAIPGFLSLFLMLFSLLLFVVLSARTRSEEKMAFKKIPHLRYKTAGALGLLVIFAILHFLKVTSDHRSWACVTSESASIFSGPNAKTAVLLDSLPMGSCVQVINQDKDWISVEPEHHKPGWTKRSDIMIVYRDKIDPHLNKD